MTYTPNPPWANGASGGTPITADALQRIENGVRDAHRYQYGTVTLESFEGASDDEKLGNALAFSQAQTYKPGVGLLENRVYGPFTTPRTLASGMAIIGGAKFSNQYRGALSTPQRVDVNVDGGGAWLRMPSSGNVFDVHISNLSFYSQSSGTDFLGGGGGVLWTSLIRDVGFSLFRHVLGSPSAKLLNTVLQLDGWWNINNGRGVAMTLGGSDSTFWPQGCLLDSPRSITDTGAVPYHLWFSHQAKSNVGPMFITADGIPAGIRITGGDSASGALVFHSGTRVEGRNAGAASRGSVVRMEGGRVTFRDAWLAYGFADPANSGRANEGGVVSVLGGRALFDGCWYSRAGTAGVAEDVPWIYASGASTRVRIRNAETAHDGGAFTGLPRVRAVNGATLDADGSVTVLAS